MAIRPPIQRRNRVNPFSRRLSDEAIGAISGLLMAAAFARLLALAFGLEQWTTTWRVVDAVTAWFTWPLDQLGFGIEPMLIGFLRPLDVLAGSAIAILALFLLATRTYKSRV